MTWASTKPLNPDEPDLPFTEEDYRKRKPHPNFKNHIQCEKDVVVTKKKIKLKDKLKTLVICCGVTYGDEEGPLHHLFKMAWLNAPSLPILGRGNNRIPLLHVRDMTKWSAEWFVRMRSRGMASLMASIILIPVKHSMIFDIGFARIWQIARLKWSLCCTCISCFEITLTEFILASLTSWNVIWMNILVRN